MSLYFPLSLLAHNMFCPFVTFPKPCYDLHLLKPVKYVIHWFALSPFLQIRPVTIRLYKSSFLNKCPRNWISLFLILIVRKFFSFFLILIESRSSHFEYFKRELITKEFHWSLNRTNCLRLSLPHYISLINPSQDI